MRLLLIGIAISLLSLIYDQDMHLYTSYLLCMVSLGGVLVLFIYMASLSPNVYVSRGSRWLMIFGLLVGFILSGMDSFLGISRMHLLDMSMSLGLHTGIMCIVYILLRFIIIVYLVYSSSSSLRMLLVEL